MVVQHQRLAITIGVLVLLGWLVLACVWTEPTRPIVVGIVVGTMLGHTTIASAWVALGPGQLIWRALFSAAWTASLIIVFGMQAAIRDEGIGIDFLALLGLCLLVQWVLVQMPLWGLVFSHGLSVDHRNAARDRGRRPMQFVIRQLMVVTLIVGVLIGLGRMIVTSLSPGLPGAEGWGIFVFLGVAATITSLPLLLAVLLPRFALPAVIVVLILAGVATMWEVPLSVLLGADGPSQREFIWLNTFTFLWVIIFPTAARFCGYGLASPKPPSLDTGPT